MVAMETSIPDFTHICFVDTPGYNPAKTGTTSKDENTAKEALENANALLWLVGLDTNGTIPASDLDFLDSLDLYDKKLYIVANKADLKPESEVEKILDHFEEVLEERGLDYEGISAYNSRGKKEITYRHTSLRDFLHSVDRDIVSKNKLAKDLEEIFLMYKNALLEQKSEKDNTKKLLHSLELDIMQDSLDVNSNIQDSIDILKKSSSSAYLQDSLKKLEQVRESMFESLNKLFVECFGSPLKELPPLKNINELLVEADEAYNNKDYKYALKLYKRAAKLKSTKACIKLGDLYENGKGIELDYEKAKSFYETAISMGDTSAYNSLGDLYFHGNGVKQDYTKAVSCYERDLDNANMDTFCNLGILYENGLGVTKDIKKAADYYIKATKLGSGKACKILGDFYAIGKVVAKDYDKAMKFYEKAKAAGELSVYESLGDMYFDNDEYAEALEHYNQAVILEQGNFKIYSRLGRIYYHLFRYELDKQKTYNGDYLNNAYKYYLQAMKLGKISELSADDFSNLLYIADIFFNGNDIENKKSNTHIQKNWQSAKQIYDEILRQDIELSFVSYIHLTFLYSQSEITDDVVDFCLKAISSFNYDSKNDENEKYLESKLEFYSKCNEIGKFLYQKGDIQNAIKLFEFCGNYDELAIIHHRKKDYDRAMLYYKHSDINDSSFFTAMMLLLGLLTLETFVFWGYVLYDTWDMLNWWGVTKGVFKMLGFSLIPLIVLALISFAFEKKIYMFRFKRYAFSLGVFTFLVFGWANYLFYKYITSDTYMPIAEEQEYIKDSVKPQAESDLERHTQKCNNKERESCKFVADLYMNGNLVAKDAAKAAMFYQSACNLDDSESCNILGRMYRFAVGVAKNQNKAIAIYKKGCDLDNGSSCNSLGYLYQHVKNDYVAARKSYIKACDLKESKAFNNLANLYRDVLGVDRNYVTAVRLYTIGVKLGHNLAYSNLADMYRNGYGVDEDYKLALKLYKEAQRLGLNTQKQITEMQHLITEANKNK